MRVLKGFEGLKGLGFPGKKDKIFFHGVLKIKKIKLIKFFKIYIKKKIHTN